MTKILSNNAKSCWVKKALYISTAVSAVMTAQAAFAQTAQQPPLLAGQDSAEVTNLGDVIVTANKREEALQDVAGAVSVVGRERFESLNALKLADYVAFVPGLQLQPSTNTGYQSIVLRGISPQYLSSTTATYVDEIPVGSASNVASGAYVQPDIDPFELQRVEVLNGPQGTLYGATSLGGLVKYVTTTPSLTETRGSLGFDAYTVAHGEEGGSLRAAGSTPLIEGKLALGVSAHYRRDAGWIDDLGVAGEDANSGTVQGLRVNLFWAPTDATTVRLAAVYNKTESDSSNTVDIDPLTRQPIDGDYDQNHRAPYDFEVQSNIYSATINHEFSNGLNLTSATGYTQLDSVSNFDSTNGFLAFVLGLTPGQGLLGVQDIEVEKTTQEFRLTSAPDDHFEWMVGGFYQRENSTPTQDYITLNPDQSVIGNQYHLVKHNTLTEYAGFANGTLHVTPSFDITLGYRYSSVEQKDDSATSGFLANRANPTAVRLQAFESDETVSTYLATASWQVSDDVTVYARAANGYRPGGSRSIPSGAPADFKTSYESDTLWNYEIGLKGDFLDGKLSTQLAAFWIDWDDIQQAVVVNTFYTTGNGGKARSRGVEAAFQARPIDGLSITGNVSYTDAEFLDDNLGAGIVAGQRIPRVAEWTGALGAEYEFPVNERWMGFAGGEYSFASSSLTFDAFKQDAYGLLGLHAGVTDGTVRVSVYAKNLTDEYKYIGASDTIDSYPFGAIVLQPRTIGITASRSF